MLGYPKVVSVQWLRESHALYNRGGEVEADQVEKCFCVCVRKIIMACYLLR